jgi:hypothetical protein
MHSSVAQSDAQSPDVSSAAVRLPKSSTAVVLGTSALDPVIRSSVASRIAADVAWLEQTAITSSPSDQQQKKDLAAQALEAVFAQYAD